MSRYRYSSKIYKGVLGDGTTYETTELSGQSFDSLEECEKHAKSFMQMNDSVSQVLITRDIRKFKMVKPQYEVIEYE